MTARGDDHRLLLDRLLDRLDAFRVLSEQDDETALAELEAIGVSGTVETAMAEELVCHTVLAHPESFAEAHGTVMKALEVLERNSSGAPALRPLGPLRPIAALLVGVFVRMQLAAHERRVLGELSGLYRRREAQSVAGSPEQRLLLRAARQVDRVGESIAGGGAALTKLLLGGAALSVVSTAMSSLLDTMNARWWVFALVTSTVVALALGACWVVLQSAAVSRRRIRITLDEPLDALYETIGGAGDPPKDPTRQFVLYSLLALLVGWIVLPVAIGVLLWWD